MKDSTATAGIGNTLLPVIIEDTITPPSPVCEYMTFVAYGCNPLVVANLYLVLHSRFKDLVRKAIVVVLRSSF